MSQSSRTPLSHLVLGLTLAVVISGETRFPGDIARELSPLHLAAGATIGWLGVGERVERRLGVLKAFR